MQARSSSKKARLPDGFTFESEPQSPGWRSVKGLNGYAMDRKTHEAGWTFFYLAGESRATVLGQEGQETVCKAIKQILAGLKSEKFNSVEITEWPLSIYLVFLTQLSHSTCAICSKA